MCTICGVTADASTAPVFYSTQNPLEPVNNNPYYYATLLTAYTKKGVPVTGTQSYIPANAPSWTLTRMFREIKPLWNARWFLYNSNVYFHRKDLIGGLVWGNTPVIDFSTGNDKNFLLEGVCYEWNGQGKIRRLYMSYNSDNSDAIGNENLNRYNGEFLDTTGNANYTEAAEVNVSQIASASFVNDGTDMQYDNLLLSNLSTIPSAVKNSIKTTTDTLSIAKILCYDPASPIQDAKAVKWNFANYYLLPEFSDDEAAQNPILAAQTEYSNYPMSFSPNQMSLTAPNPAAGNRNLWQWHQIDVPSPAKKTNIQFSFMLQYCCQFGTLNLYQKVKFKDSNLGEINEVKFDHDKRTISVKGNLL